MKFQSLSQRPNLYGTAEVGIKPHLAVFSCCKTSADSWTCHGKNTLRYGCAKLEMKWRATLFPGWQGSLCAPARCQIFQYILGVWNLLNATATPQMWKFYIVLQVKALLLPFACTVTHFHTQLWPIFIIDMVLYEVTLIKWQEHACQKHYIIFNVSCHVPSYQATGDRKWANSHSVDLLLRYITDRCWNTMFSCNMQ